MRQSWKRLLEQLDTRDLVMVVYWLRALLASRLAWAREFDAPDGEAVVIGQ